MRKESIPLIRWKEMLSNEDLKMIERKEKIIDYINKEREWKRIVEGIEEISKFSNKQIRVRKNQ